MKRNLCFLMAIIMVFSLVFAGCGAKNEEPTATTPAGDSNAATNAPAVSTEDPLKVIYLVNGSLGDKGFYDSAASGIYKIRDELGAEVKIVEMGRDETTYESNFLDVSEQGWDLVIAGTFSVMELMSNIPEEFPDTNYLGFDITLDFESMSNDNAVTVSYYANEGSFMAGVLAAQMLLNAEDERIDNSQKTLGFVGSMDISGINDFLVGYLEGIKYVDPEIRVLTSYVGSFEDVTKCMEMTSQLYNQGAQIVYAPASQSILGAATAASAANKYLIACDQDLYAQLVESDPKLAATILSSSLKMVGESLLTTVKGLVDGSMQYGNNYTLGLASGAVALAKNDNYYALVPESVQAAIEEVEGMIISGELDVLSVYDLTTEEVVALRESMG